MRIETYLNAAEHHCEQRGSKLTSLRRQVLELVLQQSGVVKAYQILALLQQQRGVAAPPTVYRALDFLVEQGLLHKIEALNGFIVCDHFECEHAGLILVCEQCGEVAELDASPSLQALHQAASERQFTLKPQDIVLIGSCDSCVSE